MEASTADDPTLDDRPRSDNVLYVLALGIDLPEDLAWVKISVRRSLISERSALISARQNAEGYVEGPAPPD